VWWSRRIAVAAPSSRAARANAVCERFLRSVRRECLDHLLIFSERQLLRIATAYVAYINHARPHQGPHQQIPCYTEEDATDASSSGKVIAFPVLNGLRHDYRLAA
jgi:putative transposase